MALYFLVDGARRSSGRSRESAALFELVFCVRVRSGVDLDCGRLDAQQCVHRHIPVPAVPHSFRRMCYYVALTEWSNHDENIPTLSF